jgi:hypothetical protein
MLKIAPLLLVIFAGLASASDCTLNTGGPPASPLTYPMTSNRYAVQYRVDGGPWTDVRVYISYYGATDASPFRNDSGYSLETSMSFVSIPARANALVQIRVTKLFDGPFRESDHVSIRPSIKPVLVDERGDGTVQISAATSADFSGEQFLLWWNRGSEGGSVEGLAFFLNPPYVVKGNSVKTIRTPDDLMGDLSTFDALDFEGTIAIGHTGNVAFTVPANIKYVFLGQDAWVQGKLRFNPHLEPAAAFQADPTRWLYGPGVLDVSRFRYDRRVCGPTSAYPDEGLYALTSTGNPVIDNLNIDGIMIADHNHAAVDALENSAVNNMKTLGWNGENAALRLQDNTTTTNVFVRSGDDSLMMWGSPVSVANATVWQNYNGGVVNLGWSDNSPGDGNTLNGLYVVKTDWQIPTAPSFTAIAPAPLPAPQPLQGQNNAVFASLMSPGTGYGTQQAPVFKNIFVEDAPQVLFSLKIMPPICSPTFLVCRAVTLTKGSTLNLNIENLFTPASTIGNSIGFQNLPAGFMQDGQTFTTPYTLTGSMSINLTNVFVKAPFGLWLPLTKGDAASLGKIGTNGNVNVTYNFALP